jgi:hypothetical protein
MKLKNQDAFKNLVGLNILNNLLKVSLRRVRHQITPYSRFGAVAPRSGPELEVDSGMQLAVARKHNQPDGWHEMTKRLGITTRVMVCELGEIS